MRIDAFVKALAAIRLDNVFNPYVDRCDLYDKQNAPVLRRENLRAFLSAAMAQPIDSVWVARDLGYRGGRRTGLPLTDEVHLPEFSQIFGGLKLHRATIGSPVAERTAAIVWRMLTRISVPVFLWNVFPYHPYVSGEPLSNRCHTGHERRACESFLIDLLDMLQPRQVVAIGTDAHRVLMGLGCKDCCYIRHPSYGGQNAFIAGIAELYNIDLDTNLPSAPSLFRDSCAQA